jgi:hypothetical protein
LQRLLARTLGAATTCTATHVTRTQSATAGCDTGAGGHPPRGAAGPPRPRERDSDRSRRAGGGGEPGAAGLLERTLGGARVHAARIRGDMRGGPLVVPPEMFGRDTYKNWRGPLEVLTAGHKTPRLIDYGFLNTAKCVAGPTLDRAPAGSKRGGGGGP